MGNASRAFKKSGKLSCTQSFCTIVLFILCFFQISLCEEEKPPDIGNFSLPASQQPSGLFAFGGNLLDKNEMQLFFFADAFNGRNRVVTDAIPSVLYGISDNLSLLLNFPFTPYMKSGRHRSAGLEDFFAQLEYAFFSKSTAMYQDQATIVANFTVPTGTLRKKPSTGFGSPSFFLGATFYRMFIDWFFFTSHGLQLMTPHRHMQVGNQFLYQCGFGRNFSSPKGWIFAWMMEVDGQYSGKNRGRHHFGRNSGGNVIYATPSLWVSNKNVLVQCGFSFPIAQHWFGRQNDLNIAFNLNFAWSFYPRKICEK